MSNIMLLSEAIISSASSNLPFLNHHHNILMEVNDAENHEGIHNDDLPSAEFF